MMIDIALMTWKTVRLDLARCEEFPDGSAHRHYLIDLPLNAKGHIDVAVARANPGRIIVRRYWPNTADVVGVAEPADGLWSVTFRRDHLPKGVLAFESAKIAPGSRVKISEPDARVRDYVVVGMSGDT